MRRNNLFKTIRDLDKGKNKEDSEQLRYQSKVIREEYVTLKEVDAKTENLKLRF